MLTYVQKMSRSLEVWHFPTKLKKTYSGVEPCRDKSRNNIKYAKRDGEGATLMFQGQCTSGFCFCTLIV